MTEFEITDNISINTNDRISIFGKTGAGKTFFAKFWLLPHYTHYIFWDIKHENNDIEHDIIIKNPEELKKEISNYRKILYQPENPTGEDFNSICEIIFNNRNTTLYVDEAAIISTPSKIEYFHNVIITQGRSYNVGIIDSSQRPRIIHNTLISESEHIFVFSLNLETDIIKLRQQIGDASNEIRMIPEHHFLYFNVRYNKSFFFKPIKKIDIEKKEIPQKLELYNPSLKDYLLTVKQ